MPDDKYTRCPGCSTVFRVSAEQLGMRGGQVRCGHCKAVFDANAHQVALAPPAPPRAGAVAGAAGGAQGTGTPASSPAPAAGDVAAEPVASTLAAAAGEAPAEDRFSPPIPARSRHVRTIAYLAAIVVLIAVLAAQAVFHLRDAIAAHWPQAQPALVRMCSVVGCTIRPLRDAAMGYLSIDASDLQADPAHRGLLVLTATLRNRAAWSLAYPYLELTLTDAQDQVVVRRALAPADYAGGTADLQRGIPPNGDVAVKVFIDASATTQAGYRLYMFYP